MRRLIVHVGPHKTGTTSIQRALFFASANLLKIGIYYPAEWLTQENSFSHYALFQQLRSKNYDLVADTASRVLKSNANTIVISAEDLSLLSVEEIDEMSRAFRRIENNLDISIVFYVRRWTRLIPSVVQELIKHGVTSTLSDIIAQEFLHPEQSDIINFVNRLDRFAKAFTTEAINVIAFDNVADSKQNLIDHFFNKVLGCARTKSDTYDIDTQHNNSLSIVEVEFLRARNSLLKSGSISQFTGDSNEYLRRLRASEPHELAKVMENSVREFAVDERVAPFRGLYDSLNGKYYRRFLNPRGSGDEDPIFRRVKQNIQYVHPNYLCNIRVLNSMITLNQKINDGATR